LKFGLYTSVGTTTCRGDPGSYGNFQTDANTFASWGIDYVKMDWCGENCQYQGHVQFSHFLNATGRPIVLELCRGTYQNQNKWGYAPQVAQLWRATGDHHDNWKSVLDQVGSIEGKSTWSGPYGWAYLDMIMTGGQGCQGQTPDEALHCPGQTDDEYRSEFSIYAISASPILIGTDIRNFTAIMNELILNPEVIAVNQDMSTPGDTKKVCRGKNKIWVRHLSNGQIAVVVTNWSDRSEVIELCFTDLGILDHTVVTVRDLWKRAVVGPFQNSYSRKLASHDSMFLTLSVGSQEEYW